MPTPSCSRGHLAGDRPWSVLGQSFGGFCAVTYLSVAPQGLREVIITGGLPGLTATAEDVYRAAYPRVLAHNERYFARYPEDEAIARRVVDALREQDARLPGGDRLTPRRFQTLGIHLGSPARFDLLHHLLEEAFAGDELSELFLRRVDAAVSFAEQPLFAALHEAIYGQGAATGWAAQRVRDEFPAFDLDAGGPVRFTGEMIYPWLFEEDPALVPLADAASRLAAKTGWPALYDPARLAANEVPVAAAIYSRRHVRGPGHVAGHRGRHREPAPVGHQRVRPRRPGPGRTGPGPPAGDGRDRGSGRGVEGPRVAGERGLDPAVQSSARTSHSPASRPSRAALTITAGSVSGPS